MKKTIFLFVFLLNVSFVISQSVPAGMKYQAIAKDRTGRILADQPIQVRIALLNQDQKLPETYYIESFDVKTGNTGLFNLNIGMGNPVFGKFDEIPWSKEQIWMEVAIKVEPDADYISFSAQQLMSVPYAFHAATAAALVPTIQSKHELSDTDPISISQDGNDSKGKDRAAGDSWALAGNYLALTIPEKFGSTNEKDVIHITNNIERMRVKSNGDLDYLGNVCLNSSYGRTKIMGPLGVLNGSPTGLSGDLTVSGTTSLLGMLNVEGMSTLKGGLDVYTKFNVLGMAPSKLTGTLRVDKAVDFGSTLDVAGFTHLFNGLGVNGGTTLTGILNVGGATTLQSTLNVLNNTTLGANLTVVGQTSLNGIGISGNATIGGSLGVNGITTLNNVLNVQGKSNLNNDLKVQGMTTMNNNLTVQGLTTLNGTLDVNGSSTFNDAIFEGPVQMWDGLYSTGRTRVDVTGIPGFGSSAAQKDNYPFQVEGAYQGIWIEVKEPRDVGNNFITFADPDGRQGRIEGQTLDNLHASFEFQWTNGMKAAEEALAIAYGIACGIQLDAGEVIIQTAEAIEIIADWAEWNVNLANNIGIAFESGSGDYAEWVEKNNAVEEFHAGQVIGIKNGKVSLNTEDADHVMAVSLAPIVLGNMPPKGEEKNHVKVAFMGQIPVAVIGEVNKGDYILASGLNDGYAIAKHPQKMLLSDYKKIVGVAWQSSFTKSKFNIINVAVGINQNDVVHHLEKQDREIQNLKSMMSDLVSYLKAKDENLPAQFASFTPTYQPVSNMVSSEIAQTAPKEKVQSKNTKPLEFGVVADEFKTSALVKKHSSVIMKEMQKIKKNLIEKGLDLNKIPELKNVFDDEQAMIALVEKYATRN